jgi:hypothetical protein
MSDKWEKPPPKLVKGKRKRPRYFIYFIIGLFLGEIIMWAIAGGILGFWLFLIILLSIVMVSIWWVITS